MIRKYFQSIVLFIFLVLSLTLVSCRNIDDTKHNLVIPKDDTIYQPSRTVTDTKVVIYDGPNVLESSNDVKIKVENHDLFVYETLVNHNRLFSFTIPQTKNPVAIFDFEGSVEVSITVNKETINDVVVRPLNYNIEPKITGNTITFTLDYPANYVIEYNGKTEEAIHLFANPIEEDTPDPNNLPDNMIYLGPGVYKADAIPATSNSTIYIAGGAVVYGQIRAENVENLTIRGRGIIDGSIYSRTKASEFTLPIEIRKSKNIKIEGITFLNPAGWAITSYFNDGVEIDNIKIITSRPNGDGISIQSSKNVFVKNSFVRSWDDSLVIKNYDRGTTENIRFENMVLWTDLAQSMEIGYETYGEYMKDIVFRNITVLHNFHKPVISIHNSDDAKIENIVFQNITVEDAQMVGDDPTSNHDDFLIDFFIQYNQSWTKSGGVRGTIKDVYIDNVKVIAGKDDIVSRISGYDKDHDIKNVNITNVSYLGTKVKKAKDLNLTINDYVSNINFAITLDKIEGAKLIRPYNLELTSNEKDIIIVPNIMQTGFLVPEFAIKDIPEIYMGQKVEGDFLATATHGVSILEWDDGSGAFEDGEYIASNVLDNNTETIWQGKSWSQENGEYAALSIYFDEIKKIGTLRVYGKKDSNYYVLQNIAVYGINSTSTNNVFTKVLNSKDYEFSPASGNCAEIKITPGEFKAIQLRFYYKEGLTYPEKAFASKVELYPASLTFGKAVTATEHEDVYVSSNITDGNPLTYYESKKGVFPAQIIIDMADVYDIKYISLYLPPLMQWIERQQTITIYASVNGENYEEIVAETDYTFNPITGNVVEIKLNEAYSARYVKFVFTNNTSPGGEGAQVSEISIFE